MGLAATPGASLAEACGGGSEGGGCGGGAGMLTLESHKAVPAPFLTKTYQLVDDPSTDHIVSWGDDHSTFVVWRPPEFARDILPNYFKHNNFSSFVRQLNTYGFRKIVPERWEFANEFFRKGEKNLLCEIHRRKTNSSSSLPSPYPPLHLPFQHIHPSPANAAATPTSYFGSFPGPGRAVLPAATDSDDLVGPVGWCDSFSSPLSSPRLVVGGVAAASGSSASAPAAASALLEDNDRLRRTNAALLSELSHMRKLYNDIIYFVQNHVRPVAPSNAFPSTLLVAPAPTHRHDPNTLSTSATRSGNAVVHKLPGFYTRQQQQQNGAKVCLNWSSATSSSSLTIAEEPSPNNNNSSNSNSGDEEYGGDVDNANPNKGSSGSSARPKLFGVSLGSYSAKRPLHPEDPDSPPATKPKHLPSNEDLGLNLGPPCPC
ncbi:hypothetical protein Taro_040171 [Colocasia esculenta]|uniref:HSF-type DNA-binding domain-containing protein n=1 Tax=Colocasia esculenta TaxID=4460 RepID=A0A843WB69_COLES|nr:hypothetical protein [Colocasia esculenta]